MSNENMAEVVFEAGNRRMNISSVGIWVDTMEGEVVVSTKAVTWEELEESEVESYMSFYEIGLPALRKVG
jgi:hypothetical protein